MFKSYLQNHKLLADGSFGTYYADCFETGEAPEIANTNAPERVVSIHKAYLEAGAKLIRTNTFASNTAYLGNDISVVKANIKAAIKHARQAIRESGADADTTFIAGDIGPIPTDVSREQSDVEEEYYQIAKTFLDEGITILNFETFASINVIVPVLERIASEELFVIVQFSVNQYGYTNQGLRASKLFDVVKKLPMVNAIGLNCGVGPGHMKQIFEELSGTDKYLIALPNAGYPRRVRNKITFSDNAAYFAKQVRSLMQLDVDIIGGCCGTTPTFIKELHDTLSFVQQPHKKLDKTVAKDNESVPHKGFIYNSDGTIKTRKLLAVELAPPFDANDDRIIRAARMLQNANVDVLTFPDSPSGRTRIDSILMAKKIRQETGMAVMPHICCRDKNAIAIRSQLLGSHINDILNFLVVTGDPIPSMVRESTKAVFNFDSVGLMQMLRDMNDEMFAASPMCYGGAINHNRRNLDIEIKRVIRKMEAGASFFLTQPIFSEDDIKHLRTIKAKTGARILCGIMPLVSRKNANFMKNEIAGVSVTDAVIERYPDNATKEEGEAIGICLAKEMIAATYDFVDGYYFSFPFNCVHMLPAILFGLGEELCQETN